MADEAEAVQDPMREALARIAREAELRTGILDLRDLVLEELPDELFALGHLRELLLGSSRPWLPRGRVGIDGGRTRMARLGSLRVLRVVDTDLTSLDFAAELRDLRELDFSWSHKITDLKPLHELTNLQVLKCFWAEITSLTGLENLTNLTLLDFTTTRIDDLTPLRRLTRLQHLNCYQTQIIDLEPIRGATALLSFDCSQTRVDDLSPLQRMSNLQRLACSQTDISNLLPLPADEDKESLATSRA